eukprot:TRINITY_DN23255_c0_g1_i1.p1 TRINITY_DN23255_c0_g1~~TRINITY_DN23255_c0_g1_i1.p1  ORF type:complete len:104 (-),score=19.72 TRINITY_DN23255_c0_g1_i1:44-319(-)
MGALSKYANAGSTGLAAARALYATAIMAYLGGIAYPRWRNFRKAEKKKKEAERMLRMGGKEVASDQKKKNKTDTVVDYHCLMYSVVRLPLS